MRGLRGEAGLTLPELLVAMAVTAVVLAAAGAAFQVGSQTVLAGADQAEAQQNARRVIERMAQEIRGAGYDPTADPPAWHFDAITNQTPTDLTLLNDFNADGFATGGVCDAANTTERVRYRLVGTTLRRSSNPANAACEEILASGIQALAFTFRAEDGSITATPALIRTVEVSVTTASEGSARPRSAVMVDRVRLRNR